MSSFEEYPHFFEVQLDLFQGPIDLLLHLVKQRELPIERVSLAEVAEQYLRCLDDMRRFDLEVAGEYLVIAATLLSIKSSLLLDEPAELVEDEEGNLIDPHEELLRKLREAEVYRRGALLLESRGQLGVDVFAPPSSLKKIPAPEPRYSDHDPILLGLAFQRLLKGTGESAVSYQVTLDSVSIVERMMGVLEALQKSQKPLSFERLVPDRASRASIIGTFIALLELCKRLVIRVQQGEPGDEILIALSSEDGTVDMAGLAFQSEFDHGEEPEEAPRRAVSA